MLANGTVVSSVSEIRSFLLDSEYKFYLTGSRYFGDAKSSSDWDFFTQDIKCVDKLKELGFEKLSFEGYSDSFCTEVWRTNHQNMQVDIQIVKDAELKSLVQENIYKCYMLKEFYKKLRKEQRPTFWNFMYACCSVKKYLWAHTTNFVPPNVNTLIVDLP